ncbi:MAG: maltose alpha-D-glucosyltransferase [Geobacteraceae bacterium GWC2_53_11]|nr:MAG: maltose alpha-D-glucosyltransferase [Geobacteraceae bacterium GWC2_53_11]
MRHEDSLLEDNPFWYRDAIIYQVHIKAFADSSSDGTGDFLGLIGKLDYLQQLGVTALWLLPFYPSPQRDDGYDIADYYDVNPIYSTLREFKLLLHAAHKRGIRVITELVLNHTSDQHPWFQRARTAKTGSAHRDFYVWSDTPEKYHEARIIFQDFETSNWTWDPVAKAYYWHRFYSHQPDLNFDNPKVQAEMLKVIDFWMQMGVDGVRLDAVPYLFEREGTNCENLPETHAFLKKLRSHLDNKFKNRLLLSEANQWPEDAAAYFGSGDESNMAFHFPLMPRMFMAIEMEDRFPIVDILDQTPAIPKGCQWAIFLRNHDELTLEMVTDEERDYMYRAYASDPRARINLGIRRRLAPLMENNLRKIELMNILLFSLPGTPIIYYGDEIGMGDNYYLGDRNGVRTPMQWNPDRNAGFSKASPQKLFLPVIIEPEYHYESINVENQERNPSSLLWWMRRTIAMRKRFKAFGCGSLEMLASDNPKVLSFTRSVEEEKILVVINLSRFSQTVTVDLSRYAGMIPEEVFSRNRFPIIQESRYHFTMGPYDYFWFELRSTEAQTEPHEDAQKLKLREGHPWWDVLKGKTGERLCSIVMPHYLQRVFWFCGKGRVITQISVIDSCQLKQDDHMVLLTFIQVAYTEWDPETYLIPMTWLSNEQVLALTDRHPLATITTLLIGDVEGVLCDAIYFEEFRELLLELMISRTKSHGTNGSHLVGLRGSGITKSNPPRQELFPSRVATVEQNNTSILYGDRLLFKMYRRLEEGTNPEPEILRFLADKKRFHNVPAYAGGIQFRSAGGTVYDLGILQTCISSHGDAWRNTMTSLTQFVEHLLSHKHDLPKLPTPLPTLLEVVDSGIPDQFRNLVRGLHLEMALLLGRRTAEMHRALATSSTDSSWSMEEFSTLYQRSLFQSMRGLVRRNFQTLAVNLPRLTDNEQRKRATQILAAENEIIGCLQKITGRRLSAMKCRIHGDFHLGQALFTGKDFVFIDFEGEPVHSLSERRLKRSPLRDVAGMIHSFHYAAMTTLVQHSSGHRDDIPLLEQWLEAWYLYVSGSYLKAYLHTMKNSPLVPENRSELVIMLRCFLIDKAIHELGNELINRPDRIDIPLRAIEILLRECRCS